MTTPAFDHVWHWWSLKRGMPPPERKGMRCRVDARGAKGSIRVIFEDGYQVITARYAVRALNPAASRLPSP